MSTVSRYIEEHKDAFIKRLREAVEIPSVSGEIKRNSLISVILI